MGMPPRYVPDKSKPKGVKVYHVDVIESFYTQIQMDSRMMYVFRRR
jgi:hypothetical protein